MVTGTCHTDTDPLPDDLGTGLVGSAEASNECRKNVMCTQLTALHPGTANAPTADHQAEAVITQLLQFNDNSRLDSANKAVICQEAVVPTTLRERLGECAANKLLPLTNSVSDKDCFRVHLEFAAPKKGIGKRMILQQCFGEAEEALGLSNLAASATHVKDLENGTAGLCLVSTHVENMQQMQNQSDQDAKFCLTVTLLSSMFLQLAPPTPATICCKRT